MRLNCTKYSIQVIPESDQDEVYLEAVTGLMKKDQSCKATRISIIGMPMTWAYVEVRKGERNDTGTD